MNILLSVMHRWLYTPWRSFSVFPFVIIAVACHNHAAPTSESGPAKPLESTHWKLVWVSGIPGNLPYLEKEPFLLLQNGIMSGSSGCNNYFGSYSIDNGQIHFSSFGSTKMFCASAMDVETDLYLSYGSTDHYRISGSQLELLGGTVPLARFEAIKLK